MKCVRSALVLLAPCSSRAASSNNADLAPIEWQKVPGLGPNGSVLPLGPTGSFDEVSNFTISASKMATSTSCTMAAPIPPRPIPTAQESMASTGASASPLPAMASSGLASPAPIPQRRGPSSTSGPPAISTVS